MTLAVAELARLSTLLEVAMDLDAQGQQAWLQALPETDRAPGPTLRRLLAAHSGAGVQTRDCLERGPVIVLPALDTGASPANGDARAQVGRAGDTVGPYRLLQPLGQGGMGSVWLAERSDGSVKRQVALKLPHLG